MYGYDAAGNRTTLTTLVAGVSNTATYTFDALNRMSSVTDANGNTTSYSFDANSNQTRIDQANGTATTMAFDALNRVTTITHLGTNNQPLAELSYTLDNTGRRTGINESNGRSSTYTYDELYRLTAESIIDPSVGNHNASFVYDAVSNRISETVNGITSAYTLDDNDRLTAKGSDTYTYDDNGNTISEVVGGQTNTYSYDSQNRLVEANMGGMVQSMSYDPDGVRIGKTAQGETTDYLTDTNRDYAQVLYESTPSTELHYTFGLDLVGLDTGSERYTYHSDALGSTRLLTDSAGDMADDIRYDAWGEQLFGGDVAQNQYLYTGEQFDVGLGKTYLRARYLDSGLGRFSQMDEWSGMLIAPNTINKYSYAYADPTHIIDPSGNIGLASFAVRSAVESTLGTIAKLGVVAVFHQGTEAVARTAFGARPDHYYRTETVICTKSSSSDPLCNLDVVYDASLHCPAPLLGSNCRSAPIKSGGFGYAHDWLPGGIVKFQVNSMGYEHTNTTTWAHTLHEGKINRAVVDSGPMISIITEGTGKNYTAIFAYLNETMGAAAFRGLDRDIIYYLAGVRGVKVW